MQIDREVIRAALEKKGFKPKSNDHDFYHLQDEAGKKTGVFTKLSHGTSYKSYGDDPINEVYHQLRLVKFDTHRLEG
jgi:hypothetical protein